MSQMIELEIRRPNGESTKFEVAPSVYTVGSDPDCHIHLPGEGIESRHAILSLTDGQPWIEDLYGEVGTTINGERVKGRAHVAPNQPIGIGAYSLVIVGSETAAAPPAVTPEPAVQPEPVIAAPAPPAPTPEPVAAPEPEAPVFEQATKTTPEMEQKRSIKQQIHHELVERLDIKRLSASHIDKDEMRERALEHIKKIVHEVAPRLPAGIRPEALVKEICDEALGLGPLEEFLADDDVTEIMVNGPHQIYVEKKGKLIRTEGSFMDQASVLAIIERIVSPLGRRIDESQPYVDARLPDGSRVNAVIHPLSLTGPCLTIRKFSKIPFTDKDLIRFGTWTDQIAEFTNICVKLRKNIVVSGGTGSGKTSLLNVLGNYLPETDRIVTIEDAAELRLSQPHVVRLEARPPNIEGKGAITIRDLVRNSLRMRPDRIVVGECRGGEALDMLQAMNTGHDGSLTTAHANTPRDTISRLETMVLMSGMDLPIRAIREQIASAIDVIVQESRFSDGSRKITSVTEICGLEGDQITMQEIFAFEQTGLDEDGKVLGHHKPTGSVPTFVEEIEARGMTIDRTMFTPQPWTGE